MIQVPEGRLGWTRGLQTERGSATRSNARIIQAADICPDAFCRATLLRVTDPRSGGTGRAGRSVPGVETPGYFQAVPAGQNCLRQFHFGFKVFRTRVKKLPYKSQGMI